MQVGHGIAFIQLYHSSDRSNTGKEKQKRKKEYWKEVVTGCSYNESQEDFKRSKELPIPTKPYILNSFSSC